VLKKLCAIVLVIIVSIAQAQEAKMNIAVIDLDPTGISNNEAQFLSDRLRTELFETGKFQVVEREKMNTILKEQGFQQSGCTTVQCAIEIGQLLNVTVMVAGSIGKIEEIYSLSIRMIDVETGAIVRTATRDYEGKLSEILTDVIPEISQELAEVKSDDTAAGEEEIPVSEKREEDFNHWGILLKLGFSFLNYTNDVNDAIKDLDPATQALFDEISNHSNIGLEVRYALSQRWKLKLGLVSENLLSTWKFSYNVFILSQQARFDFERDYQFITSYLGVNYSLWQRLNVYDIYIGVDIGSTLLNVNTKTATDIINGSSVDNDESFEENTFSWKFSLGGIYYLSSRFSLGFEMGLKGAGKFDLTSQLTDANDEPFDISRELDSGGLQLAIFIGYHF